MIKRVFGALGRTLARPYIEPVKRISADAQKIKGHFSKARQLAKGEKDEHRYIDSTEEGLAKIHSSKDAFEILYKENGWDEKQLDEQKKGIRRAKWTGWIGMFVSIIGTIIIIKLTTGIGIHAFTLFGGILSTINFASRGLKYSIFEAQLHLRDLISFKEFWSRSDKWTWISR